MAIMTRRIALAALAALAGAGLLGGFLAFSRRRGKVRAEELYGQPLSRPEGPLRVFHLGHSLVGRDMPAMLAQLAPEGHDHASQLGWGTPLKSHWEPGIEINGFEAENAHDKYRDATEALSSGQYDAVVFTEMVEIRDAVRYHESAKYLARWADLAHGANPQARLYLYETWHHVDDPEGFLNRLDGDLPEAWLGDILYPALARSEAPIYLIPAGQVMAAFVRALEQAGGVEGITSAEDLFARNDDGTLDTIHINDLGAYLVALTHYAVLYHRDPTGLPHRLARADGTAADAPSAEAAALMQRVVWDVVRQLPQTGVSP